MILILHLQQRYRIDPRAFGHILRSAPTNVHAHAFFIASFWDEAQKILAW
jgi:hypothetical protein